MSTASSQPRERVLANPVEQICGILENIRRDQPTTEVLIEIDDVLRTIQPYTTNYVLTPTREFIVDDGVTIDDKFALGLMISLVNWKHDPAKLREHALAKCSLRMLTGQCKVSDQKEGTPWSLRTHFLLWKCKIIDKHCFLSLTDADYAKLKTLNRYAVARDSAAVAAQVRVSNSVSVLPKQHQSID
jgi:hypothetical protein